MLKVEEFVEALKKVDLAADAFNPWREYDILYDSSSAAPIVRSIQLTAYLQERIGQAEYILLAEGLSYQGGKFTGIAMTSERIILGNHDVVPAEAVFNIKPHRTSNMGISSSVDRLGMAEPTASIVWKALLKNKIPPRKVVLWNIFPWHPFKGRDFLTNRTPNEIELNLGFRYFERLLGLFPNCQVLCLGKKSEATLKQAMPELEVTALRHPANGGAKLFEAGLVDFLRTHRSI